MKKINKKGFTLIEVVLVLALGALIFLIAFLAFQQASKNRRDNSRKADLNSFVAETNNYMADKLQTAPAPPAAFFNTTIKTSYLKDPKSPSGNAYIFDDIAGTDHVNYTAGGAGQVGCNTTAALTRPSDFKIVIGLEKGSACKDSL